MVKNIIKKHFTLLELMVTFSLIVICFSIIGINISEALYNHKCKDNIKKIDLYFDFCKKMAFSNQADIYLKLQQQKNATVCEIGTDDTMGFFANTKKIEDNFKGLYFLFNDKKIDKIEIIFSTTGRIIPNGSIEFFDKKKKFTQIKNL